MAPSLRSTSDQMLVARPPADLDRQTVRQRRAVRDQLKTLRAQEHVGGRAREAPAGVAVRLDGPEAVELDARRAGVHATGEEVAVADELAHETGARSVIDLER